MACDPHPQVWKYLLESSLSGPKCLALPSSSDPLGLKPLTAASCPPKPGSAGNEVRGCWEAA